MLREISDRDDTETRLQVAIAEHEVPNYFAPSAFGIGGSNLLGRCATESGAGARSYKRSF